LKESGRSVQFHEFVDFGVNNITLLLALLGVQLSFDEAALDSLNCEVEIDQLLGLNKRDGAFRVAVYYWVESFPDEDLNETVGIAVFDDFQAEFVVTSIGSIYVGVLHHVRVSRSHLGTKIFV
jgi:hypothetical protein